MHDEDLILNEVLDLYRDEAGTLTCVNWKNVETEYNKRISITKYRKLIELYKRYHETKATTEVQWNNDENQLLKELVLKYGDKNWFQVSMNFDTKNSYQCLMQYK